MQSASNGPASCSVHVLSDTTAANIRRSKESSNAAPVSSTQESRHVAVVGFLAQPAAATAQVRRVVCLHNFQLFDLDARRPNRLARPPKRRSWRSQHVFPSVPAFSSTLVGWWEGHVMSAIQSRPDRRAKGSNAS